MTLAGAVVLAVGAAGFVAFTFTGALYLDNKSSIDEACPKGVCPTDSALEDTEVLDQLGVANVIGLGVGVIGAAAGAILLWQGSTGDEAVSMSLGPAGAFLRGTF